MKSQSIKRKNSPAIFAILALISVSSCFILNPLGNFIIWIFGGTAIFCVFMMIFHLIPPVKKQYSKKMTPREISDKAYIAFHMPLVISLLLLGLLIALMVVFFAT